MEYVDAIAWLCTMRTEGFVPVEVIEAIVDSHSGIANGALASQLVRDAEQSRDTAYAERNKLVCALSKVWPSHLMHDKNPAVGWDSEWLYIVCIHSPVGQLTWHIHDSELQNFKHLELESNHWDGHTTEEKYARLESLKP